jgi:hypothetical protein
MSAHLHHVIVGHHALLGRDGYSNDIRALWRAFEMALNDQSFLKPETIHR